MSILRTICCDVPGCTARAMELTANAGWPGWGQLTGVKLAEAENPVLCPEHLARAAEFVATALAKEV